MQISCSFYRQICKNKTKSLDKLEKFYYNLYKITAKEFLLCLKVRLLLSRAEQEE